MQTASVAVSPTYAEHRSPPFPVRAIAVGAALWGSKWRECGGIGSSGAEQ
jgi:hypothetical protein